MDLDHVLDDHQAAMFHHPVPLEKDAGSIELGDLLVLQPTVVAHAVAVLDVDGLSEPAPCGRGNHRRGEDRESSLVLGESSGVRR